MQIVVRLRWINSQGFVFCSDMPLECGFGAVEFVTALMWAVMTDNQVFSASSAAFGSEEKTLLF
jgi:hypothetical protein